MLRLNGTNITVILDTYREEQIQGIWPTPHFSTEMQLSSLAYRTVSTSASPLQSAVDNCHYLRPPYTSYSGMSSLSGCQHSTTSKWVDPNSHWSRGAR